MDTKISRICDAIIESGWLAALIVTPLFFNTYSSRVFEPDKLHLLRSIALLMLVAWIVQLLDGWRHGGGEDRPALLTLIRRTPLVLAALLLVLAYVVSTLFSIVPRISFFGSYVRLQGTYTFLSYVAIFFMVLTHFRTRAQLRRLVYAIILTSLPISIYGLLQHYGLDALPWGGDVQERVAANMGNAIFVAAYLIMAFFLTLERLISSVADVLTEDHAVDVLRVLGYMFVLGIQAITIVFTQSRGPWMGWAAGLFVFGLIGVRLLARWGTLRQRVSASLPRALYLSLVGLMAFSAVSVGVMNLPASPLAGLRKVPYIGRMGTLMSTTEGTNAVRVLIWEGVVDLMLKPHTPLQFPDGHTDALNPIRPLIGYGPESLWVAFNRFYPPDLAHYEARNASPDRAHNETFDALVRTGFLGLGVQLFLYGSIFFFALRWLGLLRTQWRRNLFLGLLAGGGVLGVVVLALVDHSLRLAGLGLPSGMIAGLGLYVAIDMFIAAFIQDVPAAAPLEAAGNGHGNGASGDGLGAWREATSGRHQLLILALFAAIVAHFTEIHFGIAIASTLTHFWILAGVLVVVGMGWLREDAAIPVAALAAVPVEGERREAVRAMAAAPGASGPRTHGKSSRSQRAEAARMEAAASRGGAARDRRTTERQAPARPAQASAIRSTAPYALIAAIITVTLVWDYAINQQGLQGAWNILWQAFTVRFAPVTRLPIGSPWLLVLLLLTWLTGGTLALAEVYRERAERRLPADSHRWGASVGLYAGAVVAAFLFYGLWQAGQTQMPSLAGLDIFRHISSYLTLFDIWLLFLGLCLAGGLLLADRWPLPQRWFAGSPVLPVLGAIVLPILALVVIYDVNVQPVQADVFYKQGQAYEEAGQWEGAIVLYNQAAQMEPKEDYYYLFLGRALLEYSAAAPAGNASLPTDLSKVATSDLLPLAQGGLTNRTREELMRSAHAVLVGAQRLNPLNTDHTANLARLFRTWAFARSVAANAAPSNQALRDMVRNTPDQVDMPKLDEALKYYQQALNLSPHNAQLWNEQATVRYLKGDDQAALGDLNTSLGLDTRFFETYLLKGDVLADAGDKAGALAAYKVAAQMRPSDPSVQGSVGVYSAQLGDIPTALDAFKRVIESESSALTAAQQQLSSLDAQASQAGGYNRLGSQAEQRREALQATIDQHRNQLSLTYRNQALVLRDAKRYPDALAAAQQALTYASQDQQATIQQLISDLQKQQG